jgi:hypothetical protein
LLLKRQSILLIAESFGNDDGVLTDVPDHTPFVVIVSTPHSSILNDFFALKPM